MKTVHDWLLRNPKLLRTRDLDDIIDGGWLIITPARAYCLPPEVELSNRVLRNYKMVADRFLQKTHMREVLSWMGRCSNKKIAKCSARMGMCFTSTYATVDVPTDNVDFELADIKRNGSDFSDGIGMISYDLAMKVA
ncbi:hypothetical protein AgCh_007861 [Apium graveolens]